MVFANSGPFEMWLLSLVTLYHVITTAQGERAALVIIDVQDCFLANGSLAVKDGDDIIPVINKIRNKYESLFSLVVFSQDWHCSDHVSFASQHPGKSVNELVTLQYDNDGNLCYGNSVPLSYEHGHDCGEISYNVTQMLWPDHCIRNVTSGSTSSRIHPNLVRKEDDVIIKKGSKCEVDSYSVFYDNGGFKQTALNGVLKNKKIDAVYVTGLALDYCVYYTSLDAKKLGYKTFTIADASRGVATKSTDEAIADLVRKGVNVIQSSSLHTYLQVSSSSSPAITWTLVTLTSATIILYLTWR